MKKKSANPGQAGTIAYFSRLFTKYMHDVHTLEKRKLVIERDEEKEKEKERGRERERERERERGTNRQRQKDKQNDIQQGRRHDFGIGGGG